MKIESRHALMALLYGSHRVVLVQKGVLIVSEDGGKK